MYYAATRLIRLTCAVRAIFFSQLKISRRPQMILVREYPNFRKVMKGGRREIYSIIN